MYRLFWYSLIDCLQTTIIANSCRPNEPNWGRSSSVATLKSRGYVCCVQSSTSRRRSDRSPMPTTLYPKFIEQIDGWWCDGVSGTTTTTIVLILIPLLYCCSDSYIIIYLYFCDPNRSIPHLEETGEEVERGVRTQHFVESHKACRRCDIIIIASNKNTSTVLAHLAKVVQHTYRQDPCSHHGHVHTTTTKEQQYRNKSNYSTKSQFRTPCLYRDFAQFVGSLSAGRNEERQERADAHAETPLLLYYCRVTCRLRCAFPSAAPQPATSHSTTDARTIYPHYY